MNKKYISRKFIIFCIALVISTVMWAVGKDNGTVFTFVLGLYYGANITDKKLNQDKEE